MTHKPVRLMEQWESTNPMKTINTELLLQVHPVLTKPDKAYSSLPLAAIVVVSVVDHCTGDIHTYATTV